ncbi:DUF1552 domain-containing protein [Sorangium sp. So ce429]
MGLPQGARAEHPGLRGRPERRDSYDKMPDVGRAQMDILATALGCGITHVGSLRWTAAASNGRHPFVDAAEWHHELSHHVLRESDLSVDPDVTRKMIDINRWYASQLAYFLDRGREQQARRLEHLVHRDDVELHGPLRARPLPGLRPAVQRLRAAPDRQPALIGRAVAPQGRTRVARAGASSAPPAHGACRSMPPA